MKTPHRLQAGVALQRRERTLENHHSKASGANTPIHSYQAHADAKKKVRDNRHSRAGPVTGEKSNTGRPIIATHTGRAASRNHSRRRSSITPRNNKP